MRSQFLITELSRQAAQATAHSLHTQAPRSGPITGHGQPLAISGQVSTSVTHH